MFNTPILDVAIGLVFIFLLYSLLSTSIQETIAMTLSLRGRMLRNAIAERMLMQIREDPKWLSLLKGIWSFIEAIIFILFSPPKKLKDKRIGDFFFEHPLIKNYGSSRVFSLPSYIPSHNFSLVLRELLIQEYDRRIPELSMREFNANPGAGTLQAIQHQMHSLPDMTKIRDLLIYYGAYFNQGSVPPGAILDKAVWQVIGSHFKESQGQLERFTLHLETWFDDTMNRVSGWYKRQTQTVLFLIGIGIAIMYNVDSIAIANKLAVDKNAREQLVTLAVEAVDTTDGQSKKQAQLDSMTSRLKEDLSKTHNLVALGWGDYGRQRDSLKVIRKYHTRKKKDDPGHIIDLTDPVKNKAILDMQWKQNAKWYRIKYALTESMQTRKLLGLLVTAFAICLGAPFWFDLLSKLVRLRSTGVKEGEKSPPGKSGRAAQPITIIHQTPSGQEAVG